MKLRVNSKTIVSTLFIAAVVSILAIFSLVQLDRVVNGALYDFGLRFSYRWALPYWTWTATGTSGLVGCWLIFTWLPRTARRWVNNYEPESH